MKCVFVCMIAICLRNKCQYPKFDVAVVVVHLGRYTLVCCVDVLVPLFWHLSINISASQHHSQISVPPPLQHSPAHFFHLLFLCPVWLSLPLSASFLSLLSALLTFHPSFNTPSSPSLSFSPRLQSPPLPSLSLNTHHFDHSHYSFSFSSIFFSSPCHIAFHSDSPFLSALPPHCPPHVSLPLVNTLNKWKHSDISKQLHKQQRATYS